MKLAKALFVLLLAACSSTPEPVLEPTADELLARDSRTTRFYQLVQRAGLVDTLRTTRFQTILAPSNTALATINLGTEAQIAVYPVDSAQRLVRYHLLTTQRAAVNFEEGTAYTTRLRDGSATAIVVATSTSPRLQLNGDGTADASDLFARNGILHVLQRPLTPPPVAGTLAAVLAADATAAVPQFARLRAAVARAQNAASTRIDTALANPNRRLTLLAPTDAAFALLGYTSNASINAQTPDSLYRLLDDHLGSQRVFTNGFTGPVAGTVANAFPSAGGFIISSPGTASANLVRPYNVAASNGSFHGLDRVLLR